MDRRQTLKLLLLGAAARAQAAPAAQAPEPSFESGWHLWPDVRWAGPEFWGNRMQDWEIRDGLLGCRVLAPERTLHCLTHRIVGSAFDVSMDVALPRAAPEGLAGFRVGIQGRFDDYRSAAVHGEGLDAGLRSDGVLALGDSVSSERVDVGVPLRLGLAARGSRLELEAVEPRTGSRLARVVTERESASAWNGGVAVLSDFSATDEDRPDGPGPTFGRLRLSGEGVEADASRAFGPIYFAQYTVHRNVLKLTAQLAPIDAIDGTDAVLEIEDGEASAWQPVAAAELDPLARTLRFRVEDWTRPTAVRYRVRLAVPLADRTTDFVYEGTIASEPTGDEPIRLAVFSCNADHGFPDAEVVTNAQTHEPHVALFLGDQFYESSGGFGIQTEPLGEATLDVLHKWAMFGWSYRELFRNVPSACIPDDHDVYHGNVWGEGGKLAPTDEGWGAVAQDQGGYKMPPAWVNAVQRMQTSHLPDPVDPRPVERGIGVYFTQWDYGAASFAILEDRKFKSAPNNVLPEDARVANGWIGNPVFDIREHRDLPDAFLLGERQMRFLASWARDWSGGTSTKVVLSQTSFAAVHTIPEDADSGAVIPSLSMPEPGRYVTGDKLSVDLDSNGWPQGERDRVLSILRRCRAFHIAGDQHLASVVQNGIDAFDDAAFTFTAPALNNIWPRRWWPPLHDRRQALDDGPAYRGRFLDGLGNRITVHAAANPRATGLEPSILRDRVTGYGIVTIDPRADTIRIECWPRHIHPKNDPGGQYDGWPVSIRLSDGDGRRPVGWLPEVLVEGVQSPVIELFDGDGELVYTLRRRSERFRPHVFRTEPHTIRVGDPETGRSRQIESVSPVAAGVSVTPLTVRFG